MKFKKVSALVRARILFERICRNKNYVGCVVVVLLLLSFAFGYFVGDYIQHARFKKFVTTFKNVRGDGDSFKFINPLIGSFSAPATDIGMFVNLKNDITEYLDNEKDKGNLDSYSFYFKDLNSPLWFGINEDDSFFPASLFKLPVAIAIYKQSERDPEFLKKTFIYTKEIMELNKWSTSNEDTTLVVGNSYSVQDLVRIMLELSDNGAKDLLLTILDKRYLLDLFQATGLTDTLQVSDFQISSRKYAFFLRVLYNSSYLNEENSEYILNLLSKSDFKDGLVAGIPKNIDVAHKFGVYYDASGKEMLHDCGIVYVPDDPYVMCFMTKGKDTEALLKIISSVSNIVYEQEND